MAETEDPIQAQLAAARRSQILEAAARIFAEKGFHRATIRDVARAAGVADGTIYNYFANKTDLLLGLLAQITAVEDRPADFAAAQNLPFAEFLRAYLHQRLDALLAGTDMLRAVLPELISDSDLRTQYGEQIFAPAVGPGEAYTRHLVATGQIRPVDSPLVARLIAGSVLGLLLLQLLGDPYLPAHWADVPDALTDLLVRGLAPQGDSDGSTGSGGD